MTQIELRVYNAIIRMSGEMEKINTNLEQISKVLKSKNSNNEL